MFWYQRLLADRKGGGSWQCLRMVEEGTGTHRALAAAAEDWAEVSGAGGGVENRNLSRKRPSPCGWTPLPPQGCRAANRPRMKS